MLKFFIDKPFAFALMISLLLSCVSVVVFVSHLIISSRIRNDEFTMPSNGDLYGMVYLGIAMFTSSSIIIGISKKIYKDK